jgi:putative tricarboxylic transport membrane protein
MPFVQRALRRIRTVLIIALPAVAFPFDNTADAEVLTIVAPAAPGGGWDQTARELQQVFARVEPGVSVQVENVPGAAGTIGLARFVRAERGNPDALLVTGLVMLSAIVTNRAPVSLADTMPVARLTGDYEVIVVPNESRWRSLADLIAAFKAAPSSIAWGGGSAGGTDDVLVRLIASEVGVTPDQANYVAFPGGGAALAAVLGGQVTAGVSGYSEFAGQIQAGTLRVLALSSPQRLPGIDAPTLREQGIALDLANWRALVAPPGLTEIERARLTARVEAAARSPEWKATLARHGWADLLLTGPAFRQFLLAEQVRIEQVLHSLAAASTTSAGSRVFALTPMTLPRLAIATLAALMVAVALSGVRSSRLTTHSISTWAHTPPVLLIAALLAHAVSLPALGFVVSSVALFVIACWLFGSRQSFRNTLTGTSIALVLYIAFTRGLGVHLPADPVTRWLLTAEASTERRR